MSNANYEPLGANRKVFGGLPGTNQPMSLQQTKFVDAMGKPLERKIVTGACSKCGFAGHLPYQCRNNMPIEIDGIIRNPLKAGSSPPSDFETPLQKEDRKEREREAKRIKKQLKKEAKKRKKMERKRKRSSSTSSSDSDRHRSKKKSKKSKKDRKSKSKKRRRHSSSSSSSD